MLADAPGAAGSLVLRRMDRRKGPKLKYFIFFVVAMYLLATVAFGVKHYLGHPEQGLFDAVAGGLAWPGALVEMARSPGL